MHFGMVIVGLDYDHAGQMTLAEITGGSPRGRRRLAPADRERAAQGARYQGRKIAETASKLHG
jgi:NAD(P)H dehydrogenase (quinone)